MRKRAQDKAKPEEKAESKPKAKAKAKAAPKPVKRLKWVAVAVGMPLLIIAMLLLYLMTLSTDEKLQAVADGRMVIIDIDTGDRQGGDVGSEKKASVAGVTEKETFSPIDDTKLMLPPTGQGLNPSPNSALIETTESGQLPKVSKDGVKPRHYYAREFTVQKNVPVISIVVANIGINDQIAKMAMRLPPDISLSISPYAKDAQTWAVSARSMGHEVLVDLPLIGEDFPNADPGPYALHPDKDRSENRERLHKVLSGFTGYVGLLASPDEVFTSYPIAANGTLKEIVERGLMVAFASTTLKSTSQDAIRSVSLPYVKTDLHIAEPLNLEELSMRLLPIENIARNQGYAMVVVSPYPVTLKALGEWAQTIGKKGFILAPLSALARKEIS